MNDEIFGCWVIRSLEANMILFFENDKFMAVRAEIIINWDGFIREYCTAFQAGDVWAAILRLYVTHQKREDIVFRSQT